MKRKTVSCALALAGGLVLLTAVPAFADDSAASIAAGGLVARRETRIVMAKEVLRISPDKIVVDYDFRNDTDKDVTTEVAFPIPPYTNEFPEGDIGEQSFETFKLWVDGKPVRYTTEAKATLKGRDVTEILRANHIDIPTLGHFVDSQNDAPATRDFARLSSAAQKSLLKAGLFDGDDPVYARFMVHLQYHWTQTFPAHSKVHIRHEYSPAVGFTLVSETVVDDLLAHFASRRSIPKEDAEGAELLQSFCTDRPFLSALAKVLHESESSAKTDYDRLDAGNSYPEWVDFILTSANTWKQPIEDFTLIVDRGIPLDGYGKPWSDKQFLVSFCSPQNAHVIKVRSDTFQVHLTNFVPKSELRIGYFRVSKIEQRKSPAAK